MWLSDVGIVAMAGVLTAWAMKFGLWNMLALYMGPLAITNCWLVMYTWLQHTDVRCLLSCHCMHPSLLIATALGWLRHLVAYASFMHRMYHIEG